MKVGSTSREDILLRLGEPDKYGPIWFEYRWKMVSGYGIVIPLVPAVNLNPPDIRYLEENILHIEFDENSMVRKYEIEKKDSRQCVHGDRRLGFYCQ